MRATNRFIYTTACCITGSLCSFVRFPQSATPRISLVKACWPYLSNFLFQTHKLNKIGFYALTIISFKQIVDEICCFLFQVDNKIMQRVRSLLYLNRYGGEIGLFDRNYPKVGPEIILNNSLELPNNYYPSLSSSPPCPASLSLSESITIKIP